MIVTSKAKQMESTKAKKEGSTREPKRAKKGPKQNSCIDNNCRTDDSETSLNHKLIQENSLKLLKFGELATKIVISYYYKGSAQLNEIKHNGHFQESYHDSAIKLVKKGILNKNGYYFNLTEEGRELASNFVNYFREQRAEV